ncbi:MAG: hypothetical protein P4M01_12885 [Acidobacteriota bacterium]|nr:hypothetical protein [Acidobacteriota bacterium]
METQKINLRCEAGQIPVPEAGSNAEHVLAQLLSPRHPLDLADMSRSIAADLNLCARVTEAARDESGDLPLAVEDAIVLLGVQRLCELVSCCSTEARAVPAGELRRRTGKSISVVSNHPQIRKMR